MRDTTPDKVVQTAIKLANEHGFAHVTLANVARELGLRVPSLYNHVAGLGGLQREIRLWGLRQLDRELRRAAVGKAGEDALYSVAHAYRAFAHAQPGIYPETLRAASPDDPEMLAVAEDLLGLLYKVVAHFELSPDEKNHIIRAYRSVLHGFVDLEVAGGFEMALDRDESFQHLLDVFMAGLRSQYGAFR
jgi:AcrR family transcriptional regulator